MSGKMKPMQVLLTRAISPERKQNGWLVKVDDGNWLFFLSLLNALNWVRERFGEDRI